MLFATVLLPFAAALLSAFLPAAPRRVPALVAGGVMLAVVLMTLSAWPEMAAGRVLRESVPWMPGVAFGFRLDGLAFAFTLLVGAIGVLIVVYAHYYLGAGDPAPRFFAMLLAFTGAMLGIVLADNLVLLVVFWELTSITSFLLIGYWRHRQDARRGARMALAITGGGGLCLLAGVLLVGHIVGSYDLDRVLVAGDLLRAHPLYLPALVLVLLGAFTKSAQVPFQFWLPHAMAAPTPVSAFLHSATMVKAGVFLLARLHPALAGSDAWFWLVTLTGLATMSFAAWVAIFQHDLKGLLAYSTISHLGLITMLFGLDAKLAVVAGVFHIFNHATFKASLFMGAGIIDHETGTRDMRQLGGLRQFMPITATLAMVAAAAMAGVPLLNGFLSKEMFLAETLALNVSGLARVLIPAAATLATAFSVAYSVRFIHDVFFNGPPKPMPRTPHEPPRFMRVPVEVLVVVCVLVGLFPEQVVGPLLRIAAAPAVGGVLPSFSLAIWHGVNLPLAMSAAALAAGVLLYFGLQKLYDLHAFSAVLLPGRRVFEGVQTALVDLSLAFARRLPYLRLSGMVGWIIVAALTAAAWPLWHAGFGFASAPRLPAVAADTPALVVGLAIWMLGLVATAVAVWNYRRRLVALIAIGAVGLAVSLAFALLSAPDLALTQLLVEVATVILMMVVLYYLPPESPPERARLHQVRDALIAVACGIGITLVVYAVLTRPFAPIAPYFLERSLTEGGGSNVVNVIIVDFRGFDTLGEMTVLGIAGLIVYALLAGFRIPAAFRPPVGDGAFNPLLLQVVTRLLLPFAVLVALYLLLRGHNLPGGGFIAGLVLAAALVLTRVAGVGPKPRLDRMPWQLWIAWGLVLALVTGSAAILLGFPYLTSTFGHPVLPVVGEVPLASAALFDLGVFLAVVGATLLAVMVPGVLRATRTAA